MAKLGLYFTAGYPKLDSTPEILRGLHNAKVDFIEVGIPFSDPLADGPVIQNSSKIAIENGITFQRILSDIRAFTQEYSNHAPIYLMGYLNTFLRFGMENILQQSADAGVSGFILPDLPLDYYQKHYRALFKKYGIKPVFLICPESTPEYIEALKNEDLAFVYVVSSNATTGKSKDFTEEQIAYFKDCKALNFTTDLCLGFGISTAKHYQTTSNYFNGAIVGSAFVKALSNEKESIEKLCETFVSELKGDYY